MAESVVCPVCGKTVGAYVPAGGDGTGVHPRYHVDADEEAALAGVLDRSRVVNT